MTKLPGDVWPGMLFSSELSYIPIFVSRLPNSKQENLERILSKFLGTPFF